MIGACKQRGMTHSIVVDALKACEGGQIFGCLVGRIQMEDNSDSYKQGVQCWIRGDYGNHGNGENHGNPRCKPRVPQTTASLSAPKVLLNSLQKGHSSNSLDFLTGINRS